MELYLKTPPSHEPVTLKEAKSFLKITSDFEDEFLMKLISGARAYVEGVTGRSLLRQLWEMDIKPPYPKSSPLVRTKAKFLEIRLPKPPLLEIESVLGEGHPLQYKLENKRLLLSSHHWNKEIKVSFWSGYGEDHSFLPPDLKLSVLMAIRSLYENQKPDIPCLHPYKVLHLI